MALWLGDRYLAEYPFPAVPSAASLSERVLRPQPHL
jgi:hypothetical protein